ncbi:MAG: hypothetical protein V4539_14560 [Bacteroidota bacterium]
MKKIFFAIAAAFVFIPCFAQNAKDSTDQSTQTETRPEHRAEFQGGSTQWIKYLERNLNHELGRKYLTIPQGEKSVKQTVILIFEIDITGHTSHITVENLKDVHPELAKESIRIIARSPAWTPASQDGKVVIEKRRQKISFMRSDSF